MKVVFMDGDQDIMEHEIKGEDLKQIFNIGDQLTDSELKKMKQAIYEIPKIQNDQLHREER